jgi:hypothetical protein
MNSACTACSWNSPRDRSADTTDSAWLAAALPACTMFLPMYSYTAASTATSTSSLATRRQPLQPAARRPPPCATAQARLHDFVLRQAGIDIDQAGLAILYALHAENASLRVTDLPERPGP